MSSKVIKAGGLLTIRLKFIKLHYNGVPHYDVKHSQSVHWARARNQNKRLMDDVLNPPFFLTLFLHKGYICTRLCSGNC